MDIEWVIYHLIHNDDDFQSAILDNYIFEILEEDRAYFQSLSRVEFLNEYTISDKQLDDYKNYLMLRTQGQLVLDFNTYDDLIKRQLKSTMASQLFDENMAFSIIDQDDKMLQRVKALIKN